MGRGAVFPVAALMLLSPIVANQHAEAQSLRDRIADLFIFGAGQDPLFLGGSGDPNNPEALRAHGSHYIPAASAANATSKTLGVDRTRSSNSAIRSPTRSPGSTGSSRARRDRRRRPSAD